MREKLKHFILVGYLLTAEFCIAQDNAAEDPIVKAAYAIESSPSGVAFKEKEIANSNREWLKRDLDTANVIMAADPRSERAYSWLGRRQGTLGNFAKAIEIFTEGLYRFPESYALYRYRGFYLSRNYQPEAAIADFRKAEELVEKEDVGLTQTGIPGRSNYSPSTFKRNIYFYLAETSLYTGDYQTVIDYMDKAVAVNQLQDKDDFYVITTYYKYIALKKMSRDEEAHELLWSVPEKLNLWEHKKYQMALKFFQGRLSRKAMKRIGGEDFGNYTIAMKFQFDGEEENAISHWQIATAATEKGCWLSEAELINSK